MRRFLDRLYLVTAALGAVAMVGTLLFVLLSIAGHVFDWYVPGTDAYAGYCMAASGFLALAHTLKRGEHIRVTLVLEHLAGPRQRALETAANPRVALPHPAVPRRLGLSGIRNLEFGRKRVGQEAEDAANLRERRETRLPLNRDGQESQ